MQREYTRRGFVAATLAGIGGAGALAALSPATAEEAELGAAGIRLSPDIEPLVKLIENTPRAKGVAMMIEQLKNRVPYRQMLGALFLAATRINGSPHHSFMIHAAHQLSLNVEQESRLLPLFWALDTLLHDRDEGMRYPDVDMALVTGPVRPATELYNAMQQFDAPRAEAAIIALSRSEGAKQALRRLWRYAGRDYSYIGHRAIALANSWRVLETIGWHHAEPILQFVVRQLNEGKSEATYYRVNASRAESGINDMPANWAGDKADTAATLELLAALREGDQQGACRWTFDSLKSGNVHAQTVWDAVFVSAAELMIRYDASRLLSARPLHLTTSLNALRFGFDACDDPQTRLHLLLMAAEWTAAFTVTEKKRGKLRAMTITDMHNAELPADDAEAIDSIFSSQPVRKKSTNNRTRFANEYEGTREDMDRVSRMTFAFAKRQPDHRLFLQMGRRLVCLKATEDHHDVKFPSAIFEHYELVSRPWRPHLLAASVQWMNGTAMENGTAVQQAREILGGHL